MKRLGLVLLAGAFLLSACDFTLAGDVTPPPGALMSSQSTAEPLSTPSSPPDAAAGADLYSQHCVDCHGTGGLGDGAQAARVAHRPRGHRRP